MTEKERDKKVKEYFPKPYQDETDLKDLIDAVAEPAIKLWPKNFKDDKPYLGKDPGLTIDFKTIWDTKLPEEGLSEKETFKEVTKLFEGAPNFGSSLSMMNVAPQPNKVGLQSFMFTAIFSPNIIEGEFGWNVHKAEIESGAMLGDLAWDDGSKAGCIFTYGGEAGWQYALQYGKTRVFKDSMTKGLFGAVPGKVICSKVAQFSKQHSSVWAGIGTDNLIQVPVDTANRMKMDELEKVLKDLHEKDIPVIAVVATEGTTDANAFDSVKGIYDLMQKYPNNPAKYGKAVIFADSVIGFSWLMYKGYDFEKNPLGFQPEALKLIQETYNRAAEIKYADCYSTDFHKSGYCPYVSTSFNYKDREEFESVMGYSKETQLANKNDKSKYAYLQERDEYNPMNYSLESSRAATGSVASWATLRYFGRNGFRLINGWYVERFLFLRGLLEKESNMVVVNPDNHGQVTLFRIYPDSVKDAKAQYDKELNDPAYKAQLIEHNEIIREVGDRIWKWRTEGHTIDGKHTPYTSYSTGFRATNYNSDWSDPTAMVYALKIYPMQMHSTDETFAWVVKCMQTALKEVLAERAAKKAATK